ncbi:universal stress protein [Balneolales bacterium ANBcel1]|nr:universal stress protein [Balneolales bacterium ANBcel1]
MKNPRILVPTDLSELSLTAFESAGYLAEILDGTIIPLYVYQPEKEGTSFPVAPTPPRKIQDIEKDLDEKARKFVSEELLEPCIVAKGKPWKVIMEESEDADILVMTTHGRSGFSRLFLGSVTERVVRFSKAPVLLVEKESKIKPLSSILLTTDFSDHSLQAFDYARSLVKQTGAQIHLVHLISMDHFKKITAFENQIALIQERLHSWVDEYLSDIRSKITAEVLPVDSSVHEAIVKLTNQKKYNLVVMSTLGHSGLEYLRLGSTAANVLRLVKTAVLSINPKMDEAIGDEHRQ